MKKARPRRWRGDGQGAGKLVCSTALDAEPNGMHCPSQSSHELAVSAELEAQDGKLKGVHRATPGSNELALSAELEAQDGKRNGVHRATPGALELVFFAELEAQDSKPNGVHPASPGPCESCAELQGSMHGSTCRGAAETVPFAELGAQSSKPNGVHRASPGPRSAGEPEPEAAPVEHVGAVHRGAACPSEMGAAGNCSGPAGIFSASSWDPWSPPVPAALGAAGPGLHGGLLGARNGVSAGPCGGGGGIFAASFPWGPPTAGGAPGASDPGLHRESSGSGSQRVVAFDDGAGTPLDLRPGAVAASELHATLEPGVSELRFRNRGSSSGSELDLPHDSGRGGLTSSTRSHLNRTSTHTIRSKGSPAMTPVMAPEVPTAEMIEGEWSPLDRDESDSEEASEEKFEEEEAREQVGAVMRLRNLRGIQEEIAMVAQGSPPHTGGTHPHLSEVPSLLSPRLRKWWTRERRHMAKSLARLGSLAMFVLLSANDNLVKAASKRRLDGEHAPRDFPYAPSSVLFVAGLASVLIGSVAALVMEGTPGVRKCWEPRALLHMSPASMLFQFGVVLKFWSFKYLPPDMVALLSQTNLLLLALSLRFVLGKRYHMAQWTALTSTTACMLLYLGLRDEHKHSAFGSLMLSPNVSKGMLILLSMCVVETSASVYSEKYVKDHGCMRYAFYIKKVHVDFGGMVFSGIWCYILEPFYLKDLNWTCRPQRCRQVIEHGLFAGWDRMTVAVFCMVLCKMWLATFIAKHLDSVVKQLGSCLAMVLTYVEVFLSDPNKAEYNIMSAVAMLAVFCAILQFAVSTRDGNTIERLSNELPHHQPVQNEEEHKGSTSDRKGEHKVVPHRKEDAKRGRRVAETCWSWVRDSRRQASETCWSWVREYAPV